MPTPPTTDLIDAEAVTGPAQVIYRHSPRALGRFLLLTAGTLLVLGFSQLLDRASEGLRTDLEEAARHLPDGTGALLDALALTVGVVALIAAAADQVARRRWRALAVVLAAPAVAFAATWVVGANLDGPWIPTEGDLLYLAGLAASAAVLTAVSVAGPSHWPRVATVLLVVPALAGGAWAVESAAGRTVALLAGGALGAVVALLVGTPSRQATAGDVVAGLAAEGFPVARLRSHGGDARGSVPWLVELQTGTVVFVKTYSAEERIADLLFRLWRSVRLRESGDARPHSTLQHAVEHESFAAVHAGAGGVRTPRVIAMGQLPTGGIFSVHEAISGRSLDQVVADDGPDALGDPTLREAWSMVRTLHRSGIAHRDLRAANVVVDDDGQVWLVDFAFADVMADPELRQRDLAELLASTAALVGPERAVEAAVATLGEVEWTDALPMVQPLAVSSATRKDLGTAGFDELRELLADAVQAPTPELPRLARIDRRTVLALVAIGAAVWVLLPQINKGGNLWEQIPKADPTLLALAAVASLVTYVGATFSMKGSVAPDLPAAPTFAAQLASSFVNRVTPAKVGGVALNVRWLVREGVQAPAAAAAVSVNALGGLIVHVTLTIFVAVWAGKVGLGELKLPSGRTVLVGLGIVAAVVGLTMAIAPLRALVRHRVVPRARQSADAIGEVATRPARLAMLFGGSALVSIAYIAALALSLEAMGAEVAISTVALVYLAGSALATAAPTPGGLGATEAVFAAALIAVGVAEAAAVSAVLLYRAVTFWLPILPGWISFTLMQRAERI